MKTACTEMTKTLSRLVAECGAEYPLSNATPAQTAEWLLSVGENWTPEDAAMLTAIVGGTIEIEGE